MKNILFSIRMGCVVWFCALASASAQTVTFAEAKLVALNFFNSRAPQTVTDLRLIPAPAQVAQSNHPALYVFEPIRTQGFVIVSGEKSATPILGYSFENKFQYEVGSFQESEWMSGYEAQIMAIRTDHIKASQATLNEWSALESNTYAQAEGNRTVWPLLKTKWGQGSPYNYWCPKAANSQSALTGCVATSMAQVMRYWEWPSGNLGAQYVEYNDNQGNVQGTFFGVIGGGQYDFLNMPNTLPNNSFSTVSMALLMFHAGLSVEMNYGTSASNAATVKVADAMEDYFYYQSGSLEERVDYTPAEWTNKLQTSINSGIPVIYTVPKHMWVCDGYDDDMYHMNWGWSGNSDGFYYLNDLTPSTRNYNLGQKAIFGLIPQGINCPQTYFSSDVVNSSYTTQYWISAQSDVYANTNATFSAGDSITLRPGFDAYAGCTFVAKIGGCTGNFNGEIGNEARSTTSKEAVTTLETPTTNSVNIAPNPFQNSTIISYSLPSEQLVAMQLLDVTGKLVATPLVAQRQSEGEHSFQLDAGTLPTGMYFLVIQLGDQRQTQRLILSQ